MKPANAAPNVVQGAEQQHPTEIPRITAKSSLPTFHLVAELVEEIEYAKREGEQRPEGWWDTESSRKDPEGEDGGKDPDDENGRVSTPKQ